MSTSSGNIPFADLYSVDLVQNFPNEFFATLLSQEPLLQSSLSLLKVVILSLEGEFKQSAQSTFCDTFSVIDLPYEDTAAGIWAKLRTAQGDTQLKEQLALVTSQRRPLYDLARQLIVSPFLDSIQQLTRAGRGIYPRRLTFSANWSNWFERFRCYQRSERTPAKGSQSEYIRNVGRMLTYVSL